jgi:hypothetical protein
MVLQVLLVKVMKQVNKMVEHSLLGKMGGMAGCGEHPASTSAGCGVELHSGGLRLSRVVSMDVLCGARLCNCTSQRSPFCSHHCGHLRCSCRFPCLHHLQACDHVGSPRTSVGALRSAAACWGTAAVPEDCPSDTSSLETHPFFVGHQTAHCCNKSPVRGFGWRTW